ncbi:FAD-dependent oxidoreductase [Novosphingobium sp. AAP93]|uniref:FAD-dependent oxidoreductase n=1 Tax=Novosphingobium sp. AAP93 TaxID=1523427 RepID=UPI000B148678|nr:FAD-dependent oxidoreductase [Novosphingobium sp. AAP93]
MEAPLSGAASSDSRIRVAVIGGGCASMAAAWELTAPHHRGRYQVTVYQEGWRLGGKGASGRGENGRIEEHGLHIWLGFYDNAFRMMRACHAELDAKGLGHLYGDFRDAWTQENDIALCSASENGGFQRWQVHMPPRAGYPGDPLAADAVFSLQYYMAGAFDLLRALVLDTTVDGQGLVTRFDKANASGPVSAAELAARVAELARMGLFASSAVLAEVLAVLSALVRSVSPATAGLLMAAVDAVAVPLRQWIEDKVLAPSPLRFLWEIADLTLATLTGFLRYGIMFDPRGLDAIDDYECREWMRLNGASLRSLNSPFLRGLYDLSMGYEDGDLNKPRLSAGQGLRGTLRTFFGYRGAFMWRMRAGMGDVVFAPLYTALKERGVSFRFFHRLSDIELDAAGTHAARLKFDVQAGIKGGGEYQPLVDVQGRPCWPAAPDYAQLERGAALLAEGRKFESHWDRRRESETVLEVQRDFDMVVLGVGVGAVPYCANGIVSRDPRWQAMCRDVKTVASQAFQVWLDEDLEALGWPGPAYITGAFAKPFDTWCDMAHVVPEEAWKRPPKTSVYFCAVLRDPPEPPAEGDMTYQGRREAEVRANAEEFLEGPVRTIWPGAYDAAGQFRWDVLKADESGGPEPEGKARFGTQYWRANVNPSDRYVIHTPGSWRSRISPLDRTYDNLTIAGDWTDSGFHSGCVEGAVMSGLLAAHAISGAPDLEDIIAYDHP